ncbi:TadE family protein [Microbacterium sediminis]|uniref:TadE family protein n=1 Tax=Microbacterium sediminis TaxID=904291 RepID=A0A1B9NFN8_9MICO|nr:TadE family protein [Microbacterium sediminis]QBR75459.1 TadE family protein [Microbacterium sediminis]
MPGSLPVSRPGEGERGSASLEFMTVGVLMLVPIVYLVVTLGILQNHALGAEAAARFAARSIAQSDDAAEAAQRADAAIAGITEEYGIDADRTTVSMTCVPAGAECPAAGATVVVTVRSAVSLPFVPDVLGLDRLAVIPVEATSGQKVSRFWSAG